MSDGGGGCGERGGAHYSVRAHTPLHTRRFEQKYFFFHKYLPFHLTFDDSGRVSLLRVPLTDYRN